MFQTRLTWRGLFLFALLVVAGRPALADPVEIAVPVEIAGGSQSLGLLSMAPSAVYDNTTTMLGYYFPFADGDVVGDETTLAGTERRVQQIDLRMYSDAAVDAGTIVRLYANDGAGGAPGTVLFSSDLGQVSYSGVTSLSASVPDVIVPDTLTWGIELYSRSDAVARIGPLLYDPPTIGSSADNFWYDQGAGWINSSFGGPPAVANFGATISAIPVPEPSTFALAGLGLMGLAFWAWRSKRG